MNKKILGGSFVIVASIFALLIFATPGSTGVEVTIKDILADPESFEGKNITVSGNVVGDSVYFDTVNTSLNFQVVDDGHYLEVKHRGVRPDNFDDEVIAILEGTYDSQSKIFSADRLMTRCPSKYEGESYDDHPAGAAK